MKTLSRFVGVACAVGAIFSWSQRVSGATPPLQDLKYWMSADSSVNAPAPTAVQRWVDQAPGAAHSGTPRGTPLLTQAPFPNGFHPVVRFDGASGFDLANGSGLALQNLTVYVVASVDNSLAGRIFLGNYTEVYGWCFGISDGTAGRVKWFTAIDPNPAPNWKGESLEPAGAGLGNRIPALVTVSHTSDGAKAMYVNGGAVGTSSSTPPIPYIGSEQVTVGCLDIGRQWLVGDIAELLVFSAVDAAQRTAVENYLNAKYFQTDAPPAGAPATNNLVLWLRADAGVNTAPPPVPAYAWADQAPSASHTGTALGNPSVVQASFPNGSHPVMRFDGASGFTLANPAGLAQANLSVYVVLSADNTTAAKTCLANYNDYAGSPADIAGWVFGLSDSTAGRVKWFTAPPDSLEPAGGALGNWTPTLLTGTMTSGGTKTLYVSGTQAGTTTGLPGIRYFGYEVASVGYLVPFRQNFVGDIAEILIYSTVDDYQRTVVEEYLNAKYFLPNPPADGAPPVEDMVLWLRADAGVNPPLAEAPVLGWADQAPAGAHHGVARGAPLLAQAPFPNGSHPVVRFDGSSTGFDLADAAGLKLQNMSVYVVASVDNSLAGRIFIGNYRDVVGWSMGISDSTAGRVKWWTMSGSPDSLEPFTFPNQTPVMVTGTITNDPTTGKSTKTFYANSTLAGSTPDLPPISYGAGEQLTIGCLDFGRQYLKGDIAEVLVFNSVDDFQRAAVEEYLNAKYFQPDPPADGAPPVENMVLWLRADAGVATGTPALQVADLSPGGSHRGTRVGVPLLTQTVFPNGPHPTVHFNGASAFRLADGPGLALQDLSMYVVASVDNSLAGRIFIGNYRDVYGWCYGISDSVAGRVKWFTAITPNPGWAGESLEPGGAGLGNRVPALVTATHTSAGAKTLYLNTDAVGNSTSAPPIPYAGDEQLTVGCLDWGRQWLVGDIAEILVYSSVSEAQRTAVETYLREKYFVTSPINSGPPVITDQPQPVTCSVGATVSFSVRFTGQPPLGVWAYFKGATEVASLTTNGHAYTLTLANVQLTNRGNYTFVLSNALGMITSDVARLEVSYTWSAGAGFSTAANPSGPWSYGYEVRDGAAPSPATFSLYDRFVPASPCPLWCSSGIAGVDPNVTYNNTGSPQWCCSGSRIDWDPGEMSIGPGIQGQLTVVRWTAPFEGRYDVAASFLDNQETGDSADAYVYHNGSQLFTGAPGTVIGSGVSYAGTSLLLAAGDTLDFIIGPGADNAPTGNHSTLIASVSLNTTNRPPVPGVHTLGTVLNTPASILLSKLLQHDDDPDGDPLAILAVSPTSTQGGTVVLGPTDITYTPPHNYVGSDAFTYTLSDDRGGTAQATVAVTVTDNRAPSITGWSHDSAHQTLIINFTGLPGLTYRILFTESLSAPVDWQPAGTLTAGPNGQFSVTNTIPLTHNGFYRSVYP